MYKSQDVFITTYCHFLCRFTTIRDTVAKFFPLWNSHSACLRFNSHKWWKNEITRKISHDFCWWHHKGSSDPNHRRHDSFHRIIRFLAVDYFRFTRWRKQSWRTKWRWNATEWFFTLTTFCTSPHGTRLQSETSCQGHVNEPANTAKNRKLSFSFRNSPTNQNIWEIYSENPE